MTIYPWGSFGPPGGGCGLTVVARQVTSPRRQLLYDRHHTREIQASEMREIHGLCTREISYDLKVTKSRVKVHTN